MLRARVRMLQEAIKGNQVEGRRQGGSGGSGGRDWGGGLGAGDKRVRGVVLDDEASLHPSWVAKKKQAAGTERSA
jgi:hypothetical protein